jgi:uncharacterized membrane protein
MRKSSSFKLENYELLFSSIFTNENVKIEFKNFLKSEFNLEPFLFILEVEELGALDEKKQLEKSLYILKSIFKTIQSSKSIFHLTKKKKF